MRQAFCVAASFARKPTIAVSPTDLAEARPVCFWARTLNAASQQNRLVVELTAKAAGSIQNPERNLRKRISWARCDEAVEALDAKLLSAFIGDLKDSVRRDDEEIAGRGLESKAVEPGDGQKADGKLRLVTL